MNSWIAAGKATSQEGMKGSRAKMADAKVDAYTKWVSNIRSVSHVNSAWKSANCTSLNSISSKHRWPAPETGLFLGSYMQESVQDKPAHKAEGVDAWQDGISKTGTKAYLQSTQENTTHRV